MFQAIDTCDLGRVQGGQQPTTPGRIDPVQAGLAGAESARRTSQSDGNTGATLGRAVAPNPIVAPVTEYAGRKIGEGVGAVRGFVGGAARNVRDQVSGWFSRW